MTSNRTRHRPSLEDLEDRLVMSTSVPANTIGVASGTVPAPHATADVSLNVSQRNFSGRSSIIVGESAKASPGSGLVPNVVSVKGPAGKPLPIRKGPPIVPGVRNNQTVLVTTGHPGPLTTIVTGRDRTTGPFQVRAYLPGDITGTGQVTLADLRAFAKAYLTNFHQANYNPAADANQNGQVGLVDGKLLLRNETPLTPKIPLEVNLALAPQDQTHYHASKNSGGTTLKQDVTILGRTTPGSLVFSDSGLGDYTFTGQVLPTDAHGNFSIQVQNTSGLNNYEFLVIDPYGQQKIRAFPIFWVAYAASGSTLK